MHRGVALLCLLWIAVPTAAEKWTYGSSEHFDVYSTGGDRTARGALTYFEQVHAYFAVVFRQSPAIKARTRLIVFSNTRQFAPYRPNESAVAFYQPGPDGDYIVIERLDEDSQPIVVHEYAHLFIKHGGANYPVWLNEGLAEFYSTMKAEGGSMTVGRVPLQRLGYLRSGVGLLPLERLFAADHESAEYNSRQHAGVFYSQSWALTHMLRMSDRYRAKWPEFHALVTSGTSSANALQRAYGKSLEAVRTDLLNYISQNHYLYFADVSKVPRSEEKYVTRAVEPFEADLVTANLLASSPDGEESARDAFARLEEQKSQDLGLLEARGYFELRRGTRETALAYFARAVTAGSRNATLYRDYAILQPSKASELLSKAIALAPADPDVCTDYASVLLDERKPAEALQILRAIPSAPPVKTFRVLSLTANAFLLLNQLSEARTVAEGAMKYAQPGREADYAAQLLKHIDEYVAYRAERERARAADGRPGDTAARVPADVPTITPFFASNSSRAESLTVSVTGRVRNAVCEGDDLILEVITGGETIRLLIDNPQGITVLGRAEGTVEFKCGPQDVALTIGYRPGVDVSRKIVGRIRVLDYSR